MLYAILCYDSEDVISAWTQEQETEVMARLGEVTGRLAREGRLGPVARLLPTTVATTLRKGRQSLIIDGPFCETKEQLLGFYVVDCDSLEAGISVAQELAAASGAGGCFELRPLKTFKPGSVAA